MAHYRRNRVAGATYFFTVNLADRKSDVLVRDIARLRAAISMVQRRRPFVIDAWVILPDHMHAIWSLPENDKYYSARWSTIKRLFSYGSACGEPLSHSRAAKGERGVWQRRFWEHTIRDARDFANHMDYVHFNPVKHGLVKNAADWPYSTFHRAVAQGLYPANWANPSEETQNYGEP